MDAAVEVRGLAKRYAAGPVIGPIDFEACPGQVLAVAGANGAGKSTTLRMLLGLAMPDRGRALIMGRPYRRLEHPGTQVGAFLGGRLGDGSMTGAEYLTFMAGMMGLPGVHRRVRRVLRDCGLGRWPKTRIGRYSTGMRQRLGVAGAMLADAPILVLDEPFNGLDVGGRLWLHDVLRRCALDGRTVILAAHDIDELQRIATHVLVIMDGTQTAYGTLGRVIADNGGNTGTMFRFSPDADGVCKTAAIEELIGAGADVHLRDDDSYLARNTNEAFVFATASRHGATLTLLTHVEPSLREVMEGLIRRSMERGRSS